MSERGRNMLKVAGGMMVLAVGVLIGRGFGGDDADAGESGRGATERTDASETGDDQEPPKKSRNVFRRPNEDRLRGEEWDEEGGGERVVQEQKRGRGDRGRGKKRGTQNADKRSEAEEEQRKAAPSMSAVEL